MKHKCDIKCDECDWKSKDSVKDWHNKKCPKCHKCVIINDDDLNAYKAMEMLVDAGIARWPEDSKEKDGIMVSVDTAGLRKAK